MTAFVDRHETSLGMLLVLSGFFGMILGIASATYQTPLETAQVLMGWVSYDHSLPVYAMHVDIFTLTNYLLWAFLALTHSEIASSIILCGIMGIIALQSLALMIFVGVRNAYLAALSSVVAAIIHLFGYGIAYPIILMGSSHAFGRLGLFFPVVAIGLFAFSRFRLAFFLCGLALLVHPSWGVWVGFCLLLVLITGYKYLKPLVSRTNIVAYSCGAGISAVAFFLHKLRYPLPDPTGPVNIGTEHQFFYNYIRYWDYHRQRFAYQGTLNRELTYAAVALAISIYMFRRAGASLGEKLFAHFMMVATIAGVVFVFVPSWFPPDAFPGFLISLMPGRFVNIPLFAALPLLLGFVLKDRKTIPSLAIVAFCWAFMMYICSFFPFETGMGYRETGLLLTAVLLFSLPSQAKRYLQGPRTTYGLTNRLLAAAVLLVVACSPIYLARIAPEMRVHFKRMQLPPIKKKVLTTSENYKLQANSRVPTITPLLDGYNHSGKGSMLKVDRLMRDIYGVSLADSPPHIKNFHRGMIETEDYTQTWTARTCDQWERLSKAYEFDLIVVPPTMDLQLPRADNDPEWHKYRPTCSLAPR